MAYMKKTCALNVLDITHSYTQLLTTSTFMRSRKRVRDEQAINPQHKEAMEGNEGEDNRMKKKVGLQQMANHWIS
jgi:hypothetical protein